MKNFQQNLLIAFALGLCLLCAGQWYRETWQRTQIDGLNALVSQKLAEIQDNTNHIRVLEGQISQMDARITEMKATVKTNEQLILSQKRQLNRLDRENNALTNQVAEYKHAVEDLEGKLKEAYDGVQKQNQVIKDLVVERDGFVQKLNDSVKERNEIVAKYNALVTKVEQSQGQAGQSGK